MADLEEKSSNRRRSLESKITLNDYFTELGIKKQRLLDCENGDTANFEIDDDDLELENPASTLWMEKRELPKKSQNEPVKKLKEEKSAFIPVKSIAEYFKPKRSYTIEKLLEDKSNWEKEFEMNAVLQKKVCGAFAQNLEAHELEWASLTNFKEQEDIENFIKTNSAANEAEVTTYVFLEDSVCPTRKSVPRPRLSNIPASIFCQEPSNAVSFIFDFIPEGAQIEIMDWLYETLLNSKEASHKAFNVLKFILHKKNVTWTRPLYKLKKDLNVKSCLEKFTKSFPNININFFERKERVSLNLVNSNGILKSEIPVNLCYAIDVVKRVLVVAYLSLISCKDSISDSVLEEIFTTLVLLNMDRYLFLIQDYIGKLAVLTLRTLRGRLNWECRFESIINTLYKICKNNLHAKLKLLISSSWMVGESSLVETFRSCLAMRFICEDIELGIIQARHRLDLIYECLKKTPYCKNTAEKDSSACENLTIYMKILWFALCEVSGIEKDPKSSYLISRFLWNMFLNIPDNTPDKIERTKAKHELIFIRTWLRFHADNPARDYLDSI